MNLQESRDMIEYRRALEKFYGNQLTLTGIQGIIKEWNEDDHPRDENGRFTSGGGSDDKEDSNQGAFTRKTYYLPPKEYKKVCSEINTYYHSRFEGNDSNIIYVGDYEYRFEARGYDNYNIYGRKKIDES